MYEAQPEPPAELSGDVALQAPFDLSDAATLGAAALHVGLRLLVLTHPDKDHRVQRPVELAVPGAVQAMAGDRAGRGFDRGDAAEFGEPGLGLHSAVV